MESSAPSMRMTGCRAAVPGHHWRATFAAGPPSSSVTASKRTGAALRPRRNARHASPASRRTDRSREDMGRGWTAGFSWQGAKPNR